MNGARNELLSGARFTGDKNGRIRGRDLGHTRKHGLQRRRLAHDLLKHRCLIDFLFQCDVLFVKPVLQVLYFVKGLLKIALRALAVSNVRPYAANAIGLALFIQGQYSAFVNPADGAIWLSDTVLNIVVAVTFARDPVPEYPGDAISILRVNGLRPKTGISV